MAAEADQRLMISERIAPGALPRVLNSLVKRAFPERFEEVRVSHPYLLYGSGLVGIGASVLGALVTFKDPWNADIFSVSGWRWYLGIMVVVSAAAAIAIYAVSEYTHRREAPTPTPTPAG